MCVKVCVSVAAFECFLCVFCVLVCAYMRSCVCNRVYVCVLVQHQPDVKGNYSCISLGRGCQTLNSSLHPFFEVHPKTGSQAEHSPPREEGPAARHNDKPPTRETELAGVMVGTQNRQM